MLEECKFDFLSGRIETEWVAMARDGVRYVRRLSIRAYTAAELRIMLERVGLMVRQMFGDYEGSPYGFDSRRLIVVAQKQPS